MRLWPPVFPRSISSSSRLEVMKRVVFVSPSTAHLWRGCWSPCSPFPRTPGWRCSSPAWRRCTYFRPAWRVWTPPRLWRALTGMGPSVSRTTLECFHSIMSDQADREQRSRLLSELGASTRVPRDLKDKLIQMLESDQRLIEALRRAEQHSQQQATELLERTRSLESDLQA